ncbi:hypothetical protein [Thalassospira alkalitolerans]|uniref:hypothetical protein n=1 Tax=Thalassospira alkalitolerans TaxID=1293890 RepID=UPI003AA7E90C
MLELASNSQRQAETLADRTAMFRAKARALSRLRRWNGASDITVAQHLVDACDHAPLEVKSYILLHDIEEDETGDLITPIKNRMRELGIWAEFETHVVIPIRRKFTLAAGLEWPCPHAILEQIEDIDQRLKATEYRDAVDHLVVEDFCPGDVLPYPEFMLPWSPQKAEAQFMDRAIRYLPALGGGNG